MVRLVTFGLVGLGRSGMQRQEAQFEATIRTVLHGNHKVAVLGKGGVGKTSVAACVGSILAELRQQDRIVGIDADTAFGRLSSRIDPRAAGSFWELTTDTNLRSFTDITARLGRNSAGLYVLAGQPASGPRRVLDPAIYREAALRLDHHFAISVIDCGSSMEAAVTQEVLRDVDALIVVSSPWADGASAAANTIEWLSDYGLTGLLRRSIVVLNDSDGHADKRTKSLLAQEFIDHGQPVVEVPFDPHLRPGGVIGPARRLHARSRSLDDDSRRRGQDPVPGLPAPVAVCTRRRRVRGCGRAVGRGRNSRIRPGAGIRVGPAAIPGRAQRLPGARPPVTVSDKTLIRFGDPPGGKALTFEVVRPSDSAAQHGRVQPSADLSDDPAHNAAPVAPDPGVVRAGAAAAARRRELDISQRSLAADGIINAGALIAFEKGRSWPRERTRAKLEEVLQWPAGTIARIRRGEPTEPATNPDASPGLRPADGPASLIAQAVTAAVDGCSLAIAALPATEDPEFTERAAPILADLRQLEAIAVQATRISRITPELIKALGAVRRHHDELMRLGATAPGATLAQRLYAARRRANLSTLETAQAAGVAEEMIVGAEAEEELPAEATEAIEALIRQIN